MKLNKKKITKLTKNEANSIIGAGTNGSTHNNFTCCWCGGGQESYTTCDTDNRADPICNRGPY